MKRQLKILKLYKNGCNDLEDTLQSLSEIGYCPCLVNDDNEHWSLSLNGCKSISDVNWFESIEQAVAQAIQEKL